MRLVAWVAVMALLVLALAGFGVVQAARQAGMLAGYTTVAGRVVDSQTTSARFGGYQPVIEYAYEVGGQTYRGDRYAPLGAAGSLDWAQTVVRAHRAGDRIDVCVHPADPAQAYLAPETRFYPYVFILAAVLLTVIALVPVAEGGVLRPAPDPARTGPHGWFRLPVGPGPGSRAAAALAMAALWYGVAVLAVGHYALVAHRLSAGALTIPIGYGLLGLAPLAIAFRRGRLSQRFGEPRVFSTLETVKLDGPVIVRVELPVRRDTAVTECRLSLVCTRRTGLTAHRLFTTSATIAQRELLQAGSTVGGEYTFEVPAKKRRPSTPFHRWQYPRIDWDVELTARLEAGGMYRRQVPLEAE